MEGSGGHQQLVDEREGGFERCSPPLPETVLQQHFSCKPLLSQKTPVATVSVNCPKLMRGPSRFSCDVDGWETWKNRSKKAVVIFTL